MRLAGGIVGRVVVGRTTRYSARQGMPIDRQPGGLKALVAAERRARRPEPKPDTRDEAARARLRSAAPMSLSEIPAAEEFAVVITRRSADGSHEAIAVVNDESLVERAIRRAV